VGEATHLSEGQRAIHRVKLLEADVHEPVVVALFELGVHSPLPLTELHLEQLGLFDVPLVKRTQTPGGQDRKQAHDHGDDYEGVRVEWLEERGGHMHLEEPVGKEPSHHRVLRGTSA
jgi:hypothetical protein